jgi:hypothetical protein
MRFQLRNGAEMPTVLVTVWPMQQQILYCGNLQTRQLRGPFPSDAKQTGDGTAQRSNFFRGRSNGHFGARYERLPDASTAKESNLQHDNALRTQ